MSELSGRTLLSQWIKAPKSIRQPLERDKEVKILEKKFKSDREPAARRWDDIFKRPSEEVPENKPIEPALDAESPKTVHKSSFQPRNPFNSFIMTLKFPSHLNSQIQAPPINRAMRQHCNEDIENPNGPVRPDKQIDDRAQKPTGFQRPSYVHNFKVPRQFLETLTPRKHPFFEKRVSSNPIDTNPLQSFSRTIFKKEAPWDVIHIRPRRSWSHDSRTGMQYRPKKNLKKHQFSAALYSIDLSGAHIPGPLRTSKRLLASSSQLMAIAELSHSTESVDSREEVFEAIREIKPYDQGQFENRMWCDIYSPKSWRSHVNPEVAKQVSDWLSKQFQLRLRSLERKALRTRRKQHDSSQDSFVVDDDDMFQEEVVDDALILCGPSGSGKSSAVHAAACSQKAFVFEISSAVKRTGKEIATMLEGIAQNHAVHKAKHVVILIDDGDVIYENEAGSFWSTISKFAATSRHPIVITCAEQKSMALSGVSTETLWLPHPNHVRVTNLAWLIALSEGHILDKSRLARLVLNLQSDLRKILCQLQLWCQMGIGGTSSSVEWVPKEHEMLTSGADRVISQGTWFPETILDEISENPLQDRIESLEDQAASNSCIEDDKILTELRSWRDLRPSQAGQIETRAAFNDAMLFTNGALPMPAWIEPVTIREKPGSEALRNVFAMESSYGTSTEVLASEVAPFIRIMVAADYQRFAAIQKHLTSRSEREVRMLRRAWANNGIDTRQYLELSPPSMSVVLKTGFAPKTSDLFER